MNDSGHGLLGSRRPVQERRWVLVAAFQSEREEETRDRAERGSAVRGSDQASVAAKRNPPPRPEPRSFGPQHPCRQLKSDFEDFAQGFTDLFSEIVRPVALVLPIAIVLLVTS